MLTVRGIETRLRKLEAKRRPPEGAFFVVWGHDAAEIGRALVNAKARGEVGRGDTVVRALWTGHHGTPASRWIGERDLSRIEDEALGAEMERRIAELQQLLAEQDGAEALAAGPTAPPDPRIRHMSNAQLIAAALGEVVA
jgi:hypothetical protein